MFTGLVEGLAEVRALRRVGRGARLELARPVLARGAPRWRPVAGESIAVSGCCLTVSAVGRGGTTRYDLSRETLSLTWLAELSVGRRVNVERAVRLADRLGGHLVSGHVDALGRVAAVEASGDGGRLVTFEVPRGFERWLLPKGSIAVDGISLTIVAPRGRRFRVAVIPETLARTTLGEARAGTPVHLEGDGIGKWVAHLLGHRAGRAGPAPALRRPRTGRS
ncbi:MAG TPA: riboflavin synthase [Planctomycetota bacterium]